MGPIFIVGMPRSGTKLLREILNQHPEISIPRAETSFIPYYHSRRQRYGDLKERKNFNRFYRDFKKSSFYYHIENADHIWSEETLYNHTKSFDIKDIIEAIFLLHCEYERKQIWGDKTPEYINHIGLIKSLYPDTKIIHIIRDVRDYCLSVRKAWNKNIYRAAQKWVDSIENARRNSKNFHRDYYELKYEDLIREPDTQVKMLCAWLCINYTPAMLELSKNIENLGDATNITGILKNNYRKWRVGLKPSEIKKIEAIAGVTLDRLGYKVINKYDKQTRLKKVENYYFIIADIIQLFRFRSKEYNSIASASKRMMRDFRNKL